MKKICIAVFSLFLFGLQAQEHEAGIRFSGLSNFDLIYKNQSGQGNYHRWRLAFANTNALSRTNGTDFTASFGLAYGYEKRRKLAEKTSFIHGWEPALFADLRPNGQNVSVQLGYVFGLQYDFHPRFYINLELTPSLGMNGAFIDNQEPNYQGGIGFDSRALALSIVHRF